MALAWDAVPFPMPCHSSDTSGKELCGCFYSVLPLDQGQCLPGRPLAIAMGLRRCTQPSLIAWIEREEQLFHRLERRVVADRLKSGFMAGTEADVDEFLSFSLSVQNRRKSRAGRALENHLEALFAVYGLRCERGVETENRNRPDFLFPGQAEYRDAGFPSSRLTMLGAKSTLKDRWRQVLSEAERIETKHLLTLVPSISTNQTDEMRAKRLQLVVPAGLHRAYTPAQQEWLMNVASFIALVRARH